MTNQKWTLDLIKSGVELFMLTHNRMPTAQDFDTTDYLPTARQVQRGFGGMPSLRETLGYGKLDFTRGELRTKISLQASIDGIASEEHLEPYLVAKFGEPYVHTQKRYGLGTKNRYDFFVYTRRGYFGVDVFNTGRAENIRTNVRHKIQKYKLTHTIPTFFVIVGKNYSDDEIIKAEKALPQLKNYPHLKLMSEKQFLTYIEGLQPLAIPEYFTGTNL